jgi:hypothetical protein
MLLLLEDSSISSITRVAYPQISCQESCNIHLYVITSDMIGVYSIAEIVESSFNKNVTTIAQVIPEGFDEKQLYSLLS